MKPTVSVIIPVHNHRRFIRQCLESVINQTFGSWEIIVVDDASSDGGWEIIETFQDLRIKRLRHTENYGKEGLARTHNEALSMASGELVAVLEGDDYWPENRLDLQVKSFKDSAVVLCHGFISLVKENKVTFSNYPAKFSSAVLRNEPLGSALKILLSGNNFLLAQSVMVRKDALIRIGGFKQIPALYLVDYPTWMELALLGKFSFIPAPLGCWRRHSESITALHQEKLLCGIIKYAEGFASAHNRELKSLPINLHRFIENAGVYGYLGLYKLMASKNEKNRMEQLFPCIWSRIKIIPLSEKFKIILIRILAGLPLFQIIYGYYLRKRTSRYAP